MNLESICHKKAIYAILGNNSNKKISLFENNYVDNLYNNLIKETAKAYKLISENKSLDDLNIVLDNKRELAKEFKSATNITWSL